MSLQSYTFQGEKKLLSSDSQAKSINTNETPICYSSMGSMFSSMLAITTGKTEMLKMLTLDLDSNTPMTYGWWSKSLSFVASHWKLLAWF